MFEKQKKFNENLKFLDDKIFGYKKFSEKQIFL